MDLQIPVIQASFADVSTQGPAFVARFYEILWERYPKMEALFQKSDMQDQRATFLSAFSFCVNQLGSLENVSEMLAELGERHKNYGVTQEHYASFGECFLLTLAEYFHHEWTEELADQWTQAFATIANLMQGDTQVKAISESTSDTTPNLAPTSSHKEEEDISGKPTLLNNEQAVAEPEIEASDEPEIEASDEPEIEASDEPEIEASDKPEIETISITENTMNMNEKTATEENETNTPHTELLALIRTKAQEQARKEVQSLWNKAFEEAVQEELQTLSEKNSAA